MLPEMENADAALFVGCSTHLLYAWMFARDSVDPSYVRFLDHHGGKDKAVYDATRHIFSSPRGFLNVDLDAVRALEGRREGVVAAAVSSVFAPNLFHAIHHGDCPDGCTRASLSFFFNALPRSAKVYLPVFTLPLLLFRARSLVDAPLATTRSWAKNVGQASVFLSAYCTFAWATVCALTKHTPVRSPLLAASAGFVGGLAIFLERKSRRLELGLYMLQYALGSWYRLAVAAGLIPHVRHGPFYLFSASTAVLVHAFVRDPDLLRRSYHSGLKYLIGPTSSPLHRHQRSQQRAQNEQHVV